MGNCCGKEEPLTTAQSNRPIELPVQNVAKQRSQAAGEPPQETLDFTPDGVARAMGRPSAAPAQTFEPQQPYRAHFLEYPNGVIGQGDEIVLLDRCRWCSDHFEFRCPDGRLANIVFGFPKVASYKAASYVWETTKPLQMQCSSCMKRFSIPIRDQQKFIDLLSFASNGDWIWIDAISTDQTDPLDVADKVARMGDIYRNAKYVSVLLPAEDEGAMKTLSSLAVLAACINGSHADLSHDSDPQNYQIPELAGACRSFFEMIDELRRDLHSYTYWTRAWTFQEWAMAADIELTCESRRVDCILHGLKPLILQSATLMAIYKLTRGQYAKINMNLSRGQIVQKFEVVKQLFPCETAFNSPDTGTGGSEETEFQVMMPHLGFGRILGLRYSQPGNPFDPNRDLLSLFRLDMPVARQGTDAIEPLRERLGLTLGALSVTQRKTSYPADIVASWASMCNIAYKYDKHDSFPEALAKVLHVLRHEKHITIYNFQARCSNTTDGLDLDFFDYAAPHTQTNSYDGMTYYPGTPIFTGRADTIKHVVISMQQPLLGHIRLANKEALRRVRKLRRSRVLPDDLLKVDSLDWLTHFGDLVTGQNDGISIKDVAPFVGLTIGEICRQVEGQTLVRAQCGFHPPAAARPAEPENWMTMWAICTHIGQSEKRFVAREETNGQLVLLRQWPVSKPPYIEAYLTITDHQSGTHAMRCDSRGFVDIKLQTPSRPDVGNMTLMKTRFLNGWIDLEDEVLLVDG